jgi:hypothetical protein
MLFQTQPLEGHRILGVDLDILNLKDNKRLIHISVLIKKA